MTKKTNKEKFQEMDSKQKVQYIWEYYKWHMVSVIALILIVGEVYRIATIPKLDYKIHTVISGQINMDTEKQDEDINHFFEAFGSDLYLMPVDWSDSTQATLSNEQLLNLKIQVREMDVLMLSTIRHQGFMNIDRFDPFVKLDTLPELTPLLEKYEGQLIKGISKEDGKEYVFGIKVNKINGVPSVELGEEFIISLVEPPKDMEAAIQVLEYLLQ